MNTLNTTYTYNTWLPLFPGFYHTGLDQTDDNPDYQWELMNDPHSLSKEVSDLLDEHWWNCIDYSAYHQKVAERFTDFIAEMLEDTGLIVELIPQYVSSPREYNFMNDSFNIQALLIVTGKRSATFW